LSELVVLVRVGLRVRLIPLRPTPVDQVIEIVIAVAVPAIRLTRKPDCAIGPAATYHRCNRGTDIVVPLVRRATGFEQRLQLVVITAGFASVIKIKTKRA
jgi:hypothetical protein